VDSKRAASVSPIVACGSTAPHGNTRRSKHMTTTDQPIGNRVNVTAHIAA
jgi:hypothetical protein